MSDVEAKAKQDQYWKTTANKYDSSISFLDRHFLSSSREWIGKRVSGKTLEVAIGTGLNLGYYPQNIDLIGLESSLPMLEGALTKSSQLNLNAAYTQGDALVLPYKEASFDSVVCTFGLCAFRDEHEALAEMQRVLKPGGKLLLGDHVIATNLIVRVLQRLLEIFSIPAHGEYFTRRPLLHVESLGFDIVETERLSFGAIERVHARKISR